MPATSSTFNPPTFGGLEADVVHLRLKDECYKKQTDDWESCKACWSSDAIGNVEGPVANFEDIAGVHTVGTLPVAGPEPPHWEGGNGRGVSDAAFCWSRGRPARTVRLGKPRSCALSARENGAPGWRQNRSRSIAVSSPFPSRAPCEWPLPLLSHCAQRPRHSA